MSNFKDYWGALTPKQKRELSISSKTDYSYLSQLANGWRNAGFKVAGRLVKADDNIDINWFAETASNDEQSKQATG